MPILECKEHVFRELNETSAIILDFSAHITDHSQFEPGGSIRDGLERFNFFEVVRAWKCLETKTSLYRDELIFVSSHLYENRVGPTGGVVAR